MKDMGMSKLIFGKDNTLTLRQKPHFINHSVRLAFKTAKKIFGTENVMVLSTVPKKVYV